MGERKLWIGPWPSITKDRLAGAARVTADRSGAETPMALRSADIVDLVQTAAVIASAVLAILLVRSVVARQDRLAAAVLQVPTPPAPEMPRPDGSA